MLPFAGIPYGYAPGWCFPLIELSVYALVALCARDAWRRGAWALAYLIGGTAFGVLLETYEVLSGSYTYGKFLLMVGHAPHAVPLWIGCGWGVIMYTARLFSDAERLPLAAAAAFDTLLALNVDLGMDVVAYRMHMWHWYWDAPGQNPLKVQWFGIPYGNFIGWITVVFCFSGFSRIFERWLLRGTKSRGLRAGLVAVLALLGSLAVLVGTEVVVFPVMSRLGMTSGRRLVLFSLLLLAATVLGWRKRPGRRVALEPLAVWVPCWFHIYFGVCLFALGFWRENAWMTAASCVNLLVGVAVHGVPWWMGRAQTAGVMAAESASEA